MDQRTPHLIRATIAASLSMFSVDAGDAHPIVMAYIELLTANAGDHRRTRDVFGKLLIEAADESDPLVWLENELQWEANASALGDRGRAARADLEMADELTDHLLDHYNQRMSR